MKSFRYQSREIFSGFLTSSEYVGFSPVSVINLLFKEKHFQKKAFCARKNNQHFNVHAWLT